MKDSFNYTAFSAVKNTRLFRFMAGSELDLRLFVFLLVLLCLYRAYFVWYMADYMSADTDWAEIGAAMWMGFRLSLKSAGALALPPFVLCSLGVLILPQRIFGGRLDVWRERLRFWWGVAVVFVLNVLFEARFPYYRAFQSGYDMHVLMGMNDDLSAQFFMMLDEYGLVWRMAAAICLTVLGAALLRRILSVKGYVFPIARICRWFSPLAVLQKSLFGTGLFAVIVCFMVFIRFGGSLVYAGSVNWANVAVTKDAFLNECILDDVQAMYRVRDFAKKMAKGDIEGVDVEHVRELAEQIAPHEILPPTKDIAPYIEWTAQGARLPRPHRIFVIIGESWATWPMLDKYAPLHIADGVKGLMGEKCAYSTRAFLPNGGGTAIGIVGVITGLSAVNVDAQYQPRSFAAPYLTAMAPQLKNLGYRVDFWYGGSPSWVGMDRFTVAQGFDRFWGYPDYNAPRYNAWGTTDGHLFDALSAHLAEEDEPTAHVIMTISNHPPYNLDLAAEGFDIEATKNVLAGMERISDIDTLATELGHYWYMDKQIAAFVRRTMQDYPDSLFILTGDHAARTDPSTIPTTYEHQSIPFIIYGQGVTSDILPADAVGGHTGITPTLIELIAPQGFRYRSLTPSMTRGVDAAFSNSTWITGSVIGSFGKDGAEAIPGHEGEFDYGTERAKVDAVLKKIRTLSWYMMEKGNELP